MKNIVNMESLACSQSCHEVFRECLDKGEDESVCRMQRVPCDCSCSDDELAYSSYIRQKML
jgi:hypothetical protein